MPSRVTISVSDGFHRSVQALRGYLLKEEGLDLAYSEVVEMLAKFGALSFIDKDTHVYGRTGEPVYGTSRSEVYAIRESAEGPYMDALFGDRSRGDASFPGGELVGAMLPFLGESCRAELKSRNPLKYSIIFKEEGAKLTVRGKKRDAAVAQHQSTAVGTAEEGAGHPPAAPSK